MTAWLQCTRCGATLDLDQDKTDLQLARIAQSKGWTIVRFFGAKKTRCPECRKRQRYWHVKGSEVRHKQRLCIALVGYQYHGGLPTIWPKRRRRRTALPPVELNAREAALLRDCHYCKDVN